MNSNQLINNEEALRLFFNDDIYLVGGTEGILQTAVPVAAPTQTMAESAVLPKVEENESTYEPVFEFKYLGKNEKGILILVNDANYAVSTDQGRELLRKLVLSINLKNSDFALVNYAQYASAKFKHLQAFFKCTTVFSFGVDASTLGLPNLNLHELNDIDNVKMIFTHNLHQLDGDISAKKSLWNTLKNL